MILDVILTYKEKDQDIFQFETDATSVASEAGILKSIFDVVGDENIEMLVKLSLCLYLEGADPVSVPKWLDENNGKYYFGYLED